MDRIVDGFPTQIMLKFKKDPHFSRSLGNIDVGVFHLDILVI